MKSSEFLRTLFGVLAGLALMALSGQASASSSACSAERESYFVNPEFSGLTSRVEVGQPLGPWSRRQNITSRFFTCMHDGEDTYGIRFRTALKKTNITTPGSDGTYVVFQTSTPGVGVAIILRQIFTNCASATFKDLNFLINHPEDTSCEMSGKFNMSGNLSFRFVKTGAIETAGMETLELFTASVVSSTSSRSLEKVDSNYAMRFVTYPITFAAEPCVAESRTIKMQDHAALEFHGKGSSTKPEPFELSIKCPAGVETAYYQFDWPVAGAAGSKSDLVLPLSKTATATGIGVRLTTDKDEALADKPYKISNLKPSAPKPFLISLKAAYVQTGNAVTAGTVEAILRFTITYP